MVGVSVEIGLALIDPFLGKHSSFFRGFSLRCEGMPEVDPQPHLRSPILVPADLYDRAPAIGGWLVLIADQMSPVVLVHSNAESGYYI